MTDPDIIDAFPEYLSWDEASERYEEEDPDFLAEAIDTLAGEPNLGELPQVLLGSLVRWYRTTDDYRRAVEHVIDDAAKP